MKIKLSDIKSGFQNKFFDIPTDSIPKRGTTFKSDNIKCTLSAGVSVRNRFKLKGEIETDIFYECVRCLDAFETNISFKTDQKLKKIINKIFSTKTPTYLNELQFNDLRQLTENRPSSKPSKIAFISCKKAVNTWDLDHELMGSNQFKIGCVSDAATHLFTYCGADYNWRTEYNIGSAALDYSVRYFKKAPLGMAVTMYTNFTKIGNKSLKFIHHMVDDASGDIIMDIENYGQYFIHSTGHGIGLEVHEFPTVSYRSNTKLKENMAITVEPGIYIENKFGIRIEDSLIVKDRPIIMHKFTKDLLTI